MATCKTSINHRRPGEGSGSEDPQDRYPNTGISILIVGGGVAGLYLALECVRQGHNPTVIESKLDDDDAQPDGDYFVLGNSATGVLNHWPNLKKAVDAVAQDTWNKYYRHDGTPLLGPFPNPPRVGRIFIRKQWQELILAEVKRVGIPIFFGDKVVDYFETETKGGVILQSSRKVEADLVAACDGVHSRSWKLVLGQKVEPFPIGFSIMRCSMPTKQALQNTAVREKFGRKPGSDGKTHDTLEFLIGPDIHANMTVSEDVTCWLLVYKDHKTSLADAKESWADTITPEKAGDIINRVPGWDPVFLEMVKSSPPIVDWRLLMRNPNAKWTSEYGRVVQVGDSAHPFLPTSANGATQALEDAITLATCLRVSDTGPEGVPMVCRIYNKLRFERTAASQLHGLLNRERLHKTNWMKLDISPSGEIHKIGPGSWLGNHKPEEYAVHNYHDCAASLEPESGTEFRNSNIPPGYVHEEWDAREIFKEAAEGKKLVVKGDWS